MPILVILILIAAVSPVEWPASPLTRDPWLCVALTAAVVALPLIASAAVSRWTVRTLGVDGRRSTAVRVYSRWRRVAFYLNVGVLVFAVYGCGWGWAVRQLLSFPTADGTSRLAPFAELLVPAPYLFILLANWCIYFFVERKLAATAASARPFFTLPGFVLFQGRQFLAQVMLPMLLACSLHTVDRFFPELTGEWWFQLASTALLLVFALFLPRLMKPLLGLTTMPAGPGRDRLEATAKRLNVTCADILLWPTRGVMANAMVIGLIPWARYVIFTDSLLDGMDADEVTAVFGHEAGHVKHFHLPYYLLFLSLSSTAVLGSLVTAERALEWAGWKPTFPTAWEETAYLAVLVAFLGYLFVVFGFLSRVCERQADLAGCRGGSCGRPDCTGHDETTVLAADGTAICPTGIYAMTRALEKVMLLNGQDPTAGTGLRAMGRRLLAWLRAWQHGPVPSRIEFLLKLLTQPDLAAKHDRYAFRVRLWVVLVLGLAIVGSGFTIGWTELVKLWARV